jgi:simple sugar transport system ATP-binding protein
MFSADTKARENIFSGPLAAGLARSVVVNVETMRALADEWTKRLDVKAINDNARVVELSGGNQRKVVIGNGARSDPG